MTGAAGTVSTVVRFSTTAGGGTRRTVVCSVMTSAGGAGTASTVVRRSTTTGGAGSTLYECDSSVRFSMMVSSALSAGAPTTATNATAPAATVMRFIVLDMSS